MLQRTRRRAALTCALSFALFSAYAPTAARAQSAVITRLYTFSPLTSANVDGGDPGAMVLGPDGNFYGVTRSGGDAARNGTIFRLTPAGALTTIHTFDPASGSVNADGESPVGPLAVGSDGNLYGATERGGANSFGTVFCISTAGAFTTLHTFSPKTGSTASGAIKNADGVGPGALAVGPDGSLYGGTFGGGPNGTGVLYSVSPAGAFTVLHALAAMPGVPESKYNSDGRDASPRLASASDGYLYGVTRRGGSGATGTAYRLSITGDFTVIHNFPAATSGGVNTEGKEANGIIQGPAGDLYLSMATGGKNNRGTILRMTTSGVASILHTFNKANSLGINTDGADPSGGLLAGPDASIYGTTYSGGTTGWGAVYRLSLDGTHKIIYSCPDEADPSLADNGEWPVGPLAVGPDQALYGAARLNASGVSGALFRLGLPMILSLTPTNARAGSSPFTLTIDGTGFQSGATVYWGVTPLTTTFASPTRLTAQVTSAQLGKPGVVVIKAANPDGSSMTAGFLVTNPVPILSSITPNSANAGSPAFTLALGGKSFLPGSVVRWNGADLATTYVKPTALAAGVPADLIATAGSATVTVFNPAPGGGTSAPLTFTIPLTSFSLAATSLTRDPVTQNVTVHVTLTNTGLQSAPDLKITSAKMVVAPLTALPVSLGTVAPGDAVGTDLVFPKKCGSPGAKPKLIISGTFAGGTFSATVTVILP